MLAELAVYERFIYSLLAYYDIRLTIWEDLDFEAHII